MFSVAYSSMCNATRIEWMLFLSTLSLWQNSILVRGEGLFKFFFARLELSVCWCNWKGSSLVFKPGSAGRECWCASLAALVLQAGTTPACWAGWWLNLSMWSCIREVRRSVQLRTSVLYSVLLSCLSSGFSCRSWNYCHACWAFCSQGCVWHTVLGSRQQQKPILWTWAV